MSELTAPRTARSKFNVCLSWILGALTDPHSRVSSAARFIGISTGLGAIAYVLGCVLTHQKADSFVVGEMNVVTIAALSLRAKSTQEGKLPSARRAGDAPTPAPAPAAKDVG